MKHALLLADFLSTPWALEPRRMSAFSAMIARWAIGRQATPEVMQGVHADMRAVAARRSLASNRPGGGAIAVLPLYGVVSQRANMVDEISGSGGVSTQEFAQSLQAALDDPSVASILIDVDSPGGSVYGVSELANQIYKARGQKSVVAVANSLAASAAYWIAASASEFYCTPSGEVGSIGVYAAHTDISEAMAAEGEKVTLISAGKFKTEGNPFQPLDPAARAYMQSRIDDYYAQFTSGVAKARNVAVGQVRSGMGQGRVLGANDAKAAGMIDGVMTFDDVVQKMMREVKPTKGSRQGASSGSIGRAETLEEAARRRRDTNYELEMLSLQNMAEDRPIKVPKTREQIRRERDYEIEILKLENI